MTGAGRAAALALVLGSILGSTAGCNPALNWRQVQPEAWGLVVMMPCRPDQHQRQVPLAGSAVALAMLVCSADGHSFAVASAELADPGRVGPVLLALLAAAQANIGGRVESERPAAVLGMTPHPAAVWRQISGRLPDGQAVREQVLVFAHGLRVFQATLVGPLATDALAGPFFEAIELPR